MTQLFPSHCPSDAERWLMLAARNPRPWSEMWKVASSEHSLTPPSFQLHLLQGQVAEGEMTQGKDGAGKVRGKAAHFTSVPWRLLAGQGLCHTASPTEVQASGKALLPRGEEKTGL